MSTSNKSATSQAGGTKNAAPLVAGAGTDADADAEVKHEEPAEGGSYIRDLTAGVLVRVAPQVEQPAQE